MLESPAPEAIERERFEVLRQLEDWMEVPLLLLGFAWLALLAIELTRPPSPLPSPPCRGEGVVPARSFLPRPKASRIS